MDEMNKKYQVGDLIYDADVYDGMNTDLNDLQFYKRWLPKDKTISILELCCGTGRLTVPIAKDGYDICGIDYTASMLEQARRKASEENVDIELIETDIRTMQLSKMYDIIFLPFNSIHHLYSNEDVFRTLRNVKSHLNVDGLFLMDCFNPDIQYIVESQKTSIDIADYTTRDGRKVKINQTMIYENSNQVNRIKWQYFINGAFNSVQSLDMRMFFPQELNAYLRFCGFNIIHKFGSFKEDPFSDSSEKQIFVCQ